MIAPFPAIYDHQDLMYRRDVARVALAEEAYSCYLPYEDVPDKWAPGS